MVDGSPTPTSPHPFCVTEPPIQPGLPISIMSTPGVAITLPPRFSAIVTGIVNSDVVQEASVEVTKEDDERLASTTFSGQGVRVPLKSLINDQGYWTVGPFDFTAIITVKIISVHHWQPKDPIIVKGGNPLDFIAATVRRERHVVATFSSLVLCR
ncbi:hypothetical protein BV22DRAFT_535997 [Leucogyrophana mollusca]|uniref:Uncharacterized protein n=1 Tax=Leucogyrophana mollusca TaxID=85980 RepID=A0ACB8BGZ6_9AGAM|nr:hypothetical protein BV22DRAFT_535997 [Leucogyrophana mollusca]